MDDLPTGSVVYVSRGSFRMEAAGFGGAEGVVQPVDRVVTAPYHTKAKAPGENTGVDRLPVSATFRAPDLPSLFGSQVDVPVLEAPTAAALPHRRTLELPRVALAVLGTIVFACGIVIGAAAMHPAPPVATAPAAVIAPAPGPAAAEAPTAAEAPADEAAGPDFAPPIVAVSTPVKITARKRVAARRAAPASDVETAEPAPAKPWVDPFAD